VLPDPVPPIAAWSLFRYTGAIVGFLAFIIAGYEFIALVTPLPTISRLLQGLRDGGHKDVIFLMSLFCVCVFAIFGAWLYYHFNYQPRSGN
jgi:uncharacterized membrane protein